MRRTDALDDRKLQHLMSHRPLMGYI